MVPWIEAYEDEARARARATIERIGEEERERERSPGPERQNRCLNGVALFPSSQYLFIAPLTYYKFQFSITNLIIYESTPHILRRWSFWDSENVFDHSVHI